MALKAVSRGSSGGGGGGVTTLNGESGAVVLTSSGGTITITTPSPTSINLETSSTNTLTDTHIFVGNSSNVATDVALTLSATPGTFSLADTGILTMPNATTSLRGLLSSADWNTFNGKQDAISFALFGATPNTAGGAISGGVITLQPADATHPGGVSTTTQTFLGAKTFSTQLSVGTSSAFNVNSSGSITKINSVTTAFPSSQGAVSTIFTNNGSGTLRWQNSLQDITGTDSVEYLNRTLVDSSANSSVDWGNRTLRDSAGTIQLTWSTTGISTGLGKFLIDATGNITKINNIATSFPSAQGGTNTILNNDGSGNLTWITNVGAGAVTSMGAFGSTPNANGGTIATNTLTLQPASTSFPGGVTTAAQTFAGTKTTTIWNASTQFNIGANFFATQDTTNVSLFIGNGSNASAGATSNIIIGLGNTASLAASSNNNTILGDTIGGVMTSAKDNVLIGHGVGQAITTGGQSVAVGSLAGQQSTGTFVAIGYAAAQITTGRVTAVGWSALLNNTSGSANSAFGYSAGSSATGNNNTFIGDSAGTSTTTASSVTVIGAAAQGGTATGITVIGAAAGKTTATGNNVTVIGAGAGSALTSAQGITLIGNSAGNLITTGNNQIAIGANAQPGAAGNANIAIGNGVQMSGSSNTLIGMSASANQSLSGTQNTGIGHSTLNNAGNASNNSTLGDSTLVALTTGGSNVAIGVSAGSTLTTTSNNVLVGTNSGLKVTGSTNTYLGDGTGNQGSASSASNNIVIGSGAGTALTTGGTNVVVGRGAGVTQATGTLTVVIGDSADVSTSSSTNAIAVGSGMIAGSNQGVIGSSGGVTDFYFGRGITHATPSANVTIQPTGGIGTNIVGSNHIVAGGKGTGNAVGGFIIFSTPTIGSTGTTLQTLTEAMRINNAQRILVGTTTDDTFNLVQVSGAVKMTHLVGGTSAPTIAPGPGAGTTPTISLTGNDLGGYISITTGAAPALAAQLALITFNIPYSAVPNSITLTPANVNAALLSGVTMVYVDQATGITAANFQITSGATALTTLTTYQWYYKVSQ